MPCGIAYDARMADLRSDNWKPVIGITMGDPAGIGAEVIVRALSTSAVRRQARWVIYGMNEVLTYVADALELDPYWYRVQHDTSRARQRIIESVVVIDFDNFDGLIANRREPTKLGGLASKAFVEEAIHDAVLPDTDPRHLDAVVTGPINKAAWQLAGFNWPGHTELFAARTRAKRHAMMFISPRLRVALATTHISLMDIRNQLTIGRVFDPIDLANDACKELGIEQPRIAVTGLNPHAGEGGQFGDEEQRIIAPAIDVARSGGIDVHGPFPADSVFIRAAAGDYDAVVAMYHDQGLIPVKLLGWDKAVNWTIGLPIVRTSPDHGTAYDLAPKYAASEGSMVAALELAVTVATQRRLRVQAAEERRPAAS
jgi:4-hydroxythreonine-4-phosphate dehydrogenase